MADLVINSFFTRNGSPIASLTPSIRVWEVSSTGNDLVIGSPNGSVVTSDGVMVPLVDESSSDGFYSFTFLESSGYDPSKSYVVRVDGGASQPSGERYQVSNVDPTQDITQISKAVWETPATDHLYNPSNETMGGLVNATTTNTESLLINVDAVQTILELLLKYETNRTVIDTDAQTLTVYDDDCTTPLRVFGLFDHTGARSVTEVVERKPELSNDGKPTC